MLISGDTLSQEILISLLVFSYGQADYLILIKGMSVCYSPFYMFYHVYVHVGVRIEAV